MDYQDTGVIPSSNKNFPVSEGMSGPKVEERLNQAVCLPFLTFFSFSGGS